MNVRFTLNAAICLPDSLEVWPGLNSKISISIIHRDTPVFLDKFLVECYGAHFTSSPPSLSVTGRSINFFMLLRFEASQIRAEISS